MTTNVGTYGWYYVKDAMAKMVEGGEAVSVQGILADPQTQRFLGMNAAKLGLVGSFTCRYEDDQSCVIVPKLTCGAIPFTCNPPDRLNHIDCTQPFTNAENGKPFKSSTLKTNLRPLVYEPVDWTMLEVDGRMSGIHCFRFYLVLVCEVLADDVTIPKAVRTVMNMDMVQFRESLYTALEDQIEAGHMSEKIIKGALQAAFNGGEYSVPFGFSRVETEAHKALKKLLKFPGLSDSIAQTMLRVCGWLLEQSQSRYGMRGAIQCLRRLQCDDRLSAGKAAWLTRITNLVRGPLMVHVMKTVLETYGPDMVKLCGITGCDEFLLKSRVDATTILDVVNKAAMEFGTTIKSIECENTGAHGWVTYARPSVDNSTNDWFELDMLEFTCGRVECMVNGKVFTYDDTMDQDVRSQSVSPPPPPPPPEPTRPRDESPDSDPDESESASRSATPDPDIPDWAREEGIPFSSFPPIEFVAASAATRGQFLDNFKDEVKSHVKDLLVELRYRSSKPAKWVAKPNLWPKHKPKVFDMLNLLFGVWSKTAYGYYDTSHFEWKSVELVMPIMDSSCEDRRMCAMVYRSPNNAALYCLLKRSSGVTITVDDVLVQFYNDLKTIGCFTCPPYNNPNDDEEDEDEEENEGAGVYIINPLHATTSTFNAFANNFVGYSTQGNYFAPVFVTQPELHHLVMPKLHPYTFALPQTTNGTHLVLIFTEDQGRTVSESPRVVDVTDGVDWAVVRKFDVPLDQVWEFMVWQHDMVGIATKMHTDIKSKIIDPDVHDVAATLINDIGRQMFSVLHKFNPFLLSVVCMQLCYTDLHKPYGWDPYNEDHCDMVEQDDDRILNFIHVMGCLGTMWMRTKDHYLIEICGVGGSGKTTLMNRLVELVRSETVTSTSASLILSERNINNPSSFEVANSLGPKLKAECRIGEITPFHIFVASDRGNMCGGLDQTFVKEVIGARGAAPIPYEKKRKDRDTMMVWLPNVAQTGNAVCRSMLDLLELGEVSPVYAHKYSAINGRNFEEHEAVGRRVKTCIPFNVRVQKEWEPFSDDTDIMDEDHHLYAMCMVTSVGRLLLELFDTYLDLCNSELYNRELEKWVYAPMKTLKKMMDDMVDTTRTLATFDIEYGGKTHVISFRNSICLDKLTLIFKKHYGDEYDAETIKSRSNITWQRCPVCTRCGACIKTGKKKFLESAFRDAAMVSNEAFSTFMKNCPGRKQNINDDEGSPDTHVWVLQHRNVSQKACMFKHYDFLIGE